MIVVKAHNTGDTITASLPGCSERLRSAPEVTQHQCRPELLRIPPAPLAAATLSTAHLRYLRLLL